MTDLSFLGEIFFTFSELMWVQNIHNMFTQIMNFINKYNISEL